MNSLCTIPSPRKFIVWLTFSIALMTIIFFMLTDIHRSSVDSIQNESTSSLIEDSRLLVNESELDYDEMKYLSEGYPFCSEKPFLLILVASAPENFERREAIRKSWANKERWKLQISAQSKTVFLVGTSSKNFLNELLKNESIISGDVLIGEYLDTYRNLTLKVLHGFQWAKNHCLSDFLLKTDDDCFVNVPIIIQYMRNIKPVPVNLYAGRTRWSVYVVRDPKSRWYNARLEHPEPTYAPYSFGIGYIISGDVLEKLVMFCDEVHVFPNEDAYVGAVLHLAGIIPTYSNRFVIYSNPWQGCDFMYFFVVHGIEASSQIQHQDMANRAVDLCSNDTIVHLWV